MSSYSDVLSTGITRYGIIAVVVTTVLSVLAAILAVMRFMLRRKVGFGTDDYLLMVVLLFLMIQLIIQYLSTFGSPLVVNDPRGLVQCFAMSETLQNGR